MLLELHVADSGDDGQHFSPLSAAFFGLLVCQLIPVAC